MGAGMLTVDRHREADGALERTVGPLTEEHVGPVFERLAQAGDQQLLPLERDFESGLIDARHLHAQLQRVAEVEQVGLGRECVGARIARDERLDAVAHLDQLVEVGSRPEALEVHGPECSTGQERTRYAACVRDALTRIPVLAAPTASGKTAAVLRLARRWPLEVVSADAMQVYRGLRIGTASPSDEERRRVRHHLVGDVDPTEPFSVASYVRKAEAAIADVLARGRVPLVVGGSGFYLEALAVGLPTTPRADRSVQAVIAAELEAVGLEALLDELGAISPEDARRTQRNPRRVVRAVEVLRRTGRPPSAFAPLPPRFRYAFAVVLPPSATLQALVRVRTQAMIADGWLEEVRSLVPAMDAWATARQAIGYEPLRRVLTGELRLADAVAGIEQATLRYAKRQRTWFRRRPQAARRWYGSVAEHEAELERWLEDVIG